MFNCNKRRITLDYIWGWLIWSIQRRIDIRYPHGINPYPYKHAFKQGGGKKTG